MPSFDFGPLKLVLYVPLGTPDNSPPIHRWELARKPLYRRKSAFACSDSIVFMSFSLSLSLWESRPLGAGEGSSTTFELARTVIPAPISCRLMSGRL